MINRACRIGLLSNHDPLNFIERNLIAGAVIELGSFRAFVIGDPPGVLDASPKQLRCRRREAQDPRCAFLIASSIAAPPCVSSQRTTGVVSVRAGGQFSP